MSSLAQTNRASQVRPSRSQIPSGAEGRPSPSNAEGRQDLEPVFTRSVAKLSGGIHTVATLSGGIHSKSGLLCRLGLVQFPFSVTQPQVCIEQLTLMQPQMNELVHSPGLRVS